MDGTGRLPYTTGENESKPLFGFFYFSLEKIRRRGVDEGRNSQIIASTDVGR